MPNPGLVSHCLCPSILRLSGYLLSESPSLPLGTIAILWEPPAPDERAPCHSPDSILTATMLGLLEQAVPPQGSHMDAGKASPPPARERNPGALGNSSFSLLKRVSTPLFPLGAWLPCLRALSSWRGAQLRRHQCVRSLCQQLLSLEAPQMAHLESAPSAPQAEGDSSASTASSRIAGTRSLSHSNTTDTHKQNHTPPQTQTHRQPDHIQTHERVLLDSRIGEKPHAKVTCNHTHSHPNNRTCPHVPQTHSHAQSDPQSHPRFPGRTLGLSRALESVRPGESLPLVPPAL